MIIFQVDTFTKEPFKGNPAGVCFTDKPLDDKTMQNIASEMGLSETAFLYKINSNTYNLRWFTPVCEVTMCGHATLASAYLLYKNRLVSENIHVTFKTLSGNLYCYYNNKLITISFPAFIDGFEHSIQDISECLHYSPDRIVKFEYGLDIIYMCIFKDEDIIKRLRPDFDSLRQHEALGIICTSMSDRKNIDFVSRFFAPRVGIDEDSVTAMAHSFMVPYWAKRLSKLRLNAMQLSERTGFLKCTIRKDRVHLMGDCVETMKCELLV